MDIWSFGVCCYEIISFKLPYSNPVDVCDVNKNFKPLDSQTSALEIKLVDIMLDRHFWNRPTADEISQMISEEMRLNAPLPFSNELQGNFESMSISGANSEDHNTSSSNRSRVTSSLASRRSNVSSTSSPAASIQFAPGHTLIINRTSQGNKWASQCLGEYRYDPATGLFKQWSSLQHDKVEPRYIYHWNKKEWFVIMILQVKLKVGYAT